MKIWREMAAEQAPVKEGDILAGKYRVERVLGVGGMGVVVAAMHLELDQRVALKFLLPSALESQEAVERFQREAKAAIKLKSEHVARVIDVGKLDDGAPYIVMEYLDGLDLSRIVGELRQLTIEDAVWFVVQAAEAIAEAHSLGIVHRDLKPQNLFVTRRIDGRPLVKVLDFGISKSINQSQSAMSLTRTTSVMGSPLYMSPEQMRSTKNVDQRSDIWALGVILYELLTGRVPFEADAVPELCLKVVQDPATPPHELRPELPEQLSAAVLRCLEKDPDARFQNIAEVVGALEPFCPENERGAAERIANVLKVRPSSSPGAPIPPEIARSNPKVKTNVSWGADSQRSSTPAPGRRNLAVLAGIGAVALIGAIALVAFKVGRSEGGANAAAAVTASATVTATAPATATATAPETATATAGTATATTVAAVVPTVAVATAGATHLGPRATASASAKPVAAKDAGAAAVTAPPRTFNE